MFRHSICIIFLVIVITGCSQGGSPITPKSGSDDSHLSPIVDFSQSTGDVIPTIGLMGAWEIHINPDDMSADLIAKRSSAIGEAWIISGINYFVMSPCATCLKMTGLELLPTGIVVAKFNIRHPFEPGDKLKPPSATNRLDLDVFDVALIVYPQNISPQTFNQTGRSVYSNICESPDGYTTELSSFIGDQAALPYYLVIDDSITGTSTFNKFEMGASADFDARFDLSAGTVMFDLYLTMGYGASAIRPERLEPKYYNPEFNRNAAWKVKVFAPEPAEAGYTWDDDDPNTTYDVVVHVYDWQQGATVYDNPEDFHNAPDDNIYASSNVASVSVEIPGMTASLPIVTSPLTGDGSPMNPLEYNLSIANENLIAAGEYTGLVRVLDERAPSSNYMIENRDYLINTPDGVTLHEYLMTEYATYQTFTATVVESEIVEPTGDLMWAKRAGGSSSDHGESVTTLSDNSTVVTGYFSRDAVFGEGDPNETTLTSVGVGDMFIARYNPDGTLVWAKSAGGEESDLGYGITTLSDDTVVVAGIFQESATFGRGETNETTIISSGSRDIFIARYNPDGTLLWAKHAGGGRDQDYVRSIVSLSDDSTVITGQFRDSATFGPGDPNETVLVSGGGSDIFIAKYDSDGLIQWAKRAGGSGLNLSGYAVTALSDDSTAVTGFFQGSAVFGQGEPGETILHSAGNGDIFIALYNPNGTLAWAKRAGGIESNNCGYGITRLSDDSLVVTGQFAIEAIFGEGEPNETTLVSDGFLDIFIARYNPDGTLVWAKRAGSEIDNSGFDVTSLPDDSFAVVGYFMGSAVFGPGEPNETILETDAAHDIFIARYNPDGTLQWARKATGSHRNYSSSVTVLSDYSLVITGVISIECTFGEGEPNEITLFTDGPSTDVFVARYAP